jgi:signal transduction histidine kinase
VGDPGDLRDDATQQLRALLDANRTILADLDLTLVLRRIVESAVGLVGAEYGALAVVGDDGALEESVEVGRPVGDATGAFLSVPVPVRDGAHGTLALTRDGGGAFTARDEELLEALASTAGVAIDNARMLEEAELRQRWLAASTEVTRRVLTGDGSAMRLVARSVHTLTAAKLTTLVQPVESELLVEVAEGVDSERIEGSRYPASGTLSNHVIRLGKPIRVLDAEDTRTVDGRTIYLAGQIRVGPAMILPLLGREEVRGTLVVMRERGARPFSSADAEMATTFANHASVALELAEARRAQQRVVLLEERARIARDLHDHVIQQVFAAGLVVQATASRLDDPTSHASLQEVVTNLDQAIKQIRVSIFQLQPPVPGGLRAAVMDVVADVQPGLRLDPRVDLDGPLDSVATSDLVSDVTAVVREGLVNVARHASASAVELSIHATTARLTVTISDDGVGVGDAVRRSGLDNMRMRAENRHGSMVVAEVPDLGGTTLVWTVPIT